MKIKKIGNTLIQILKSITKHKIGFIFSILCCIFGILQIYSGDIFTGPKNSIKYDIFGKICLAFVMGAFFSLPADYLTNKLSTLKKYIIQLITVILATTLGFCILYFVKEESYATMYYLGILFAEIAITAYIFMPKDNPDSYFSNICKHFLFSGIITLIGTLGCLLLFWAFSSLLYNIEDFDNLALSIFVFFGAIVYFNLFSYYLFEKRTEPSGKGFKIVFMYVLLPVYISLILILYIYILKSIILLKLPSGKINWFVSFATTFYIVFYFVLKEYADNKLVKFFYKAGAFILLPLVCVQLPSFFIRINAYGFTGWRFSSLLYIIFSIITICSTFIKKGKYTKFAIPLLAGFIIVASIGPFNLIDIAYNSQYKIMEKVLLKYNMMESDHLADYDKDYINSTITDEDREKLSGSYFYIRNRSEHKKPKWLNEHGKWSFESVFGISASSNEDYYTFTYYIDKKIAKKLNIEGFKYISKGSAYKYLSSDSTPVENIKLTEPNIDITDFILSLDEKNKDYIYYEVDDKTTLVFYDINYYCKNKTSKTLYRYSINYYILEK